MPKFHHNLSRRLKHELHHLRNRQRLSLYFIFGLGVIEYYDFFAFAFGFYFLLKVLGHHLVELYGIALVAMVSFMVRPLGYRLQIWLLQRYKRSVILTLNSLLMTCSILATAFTPIHETEHLWKILGWLCWWRFIHGISFGIKMQSSLTFIKTSFPRRVHSAVGSAIIGAQFGLTCAVFVNKILYSHLTAAELEWGWRIPFLIGAALCIILYIFRMFIYIPLVRHTPPQPQQSLPLDKVALKSGVNLWRALALASVRGGLVFTIFVLLPILFNWLQGWNFKQITNLALAATITNSLVSYLARNSKVNLQQKNILLIALWLILPISFSLGYAMLYKNNLALVACTIMLTLINGYLFVIIPRFIQSLFNYEHRLEALLFVWNFEFFNYNFIRRFSLFMVAEILGSIVLDREIYAIMLICALWVVTLTGIAAIRKIIAAAPLSRV